MDSVGIKIQTGNSAGKPKANGGLKHLTGYGHRPKAANHSRPPVALGFQTATWNGISGYYNLLNYFLKFTFWKKFL